MGWHQSSSQGAEGASAEEFSWTQVAMVEMALSLNCVRRMPREAPATSGRWRAAPAEARRALGEKGLAVPLCPVAEVTAPVAPNAAAVRRIVPTLPGS